MSLFIKLLSAVIFLFLPLILFSDDLFKKDMELAELGNSGAEYRIGSAYLNGQGVDKDYDKAFFWLEKAAAKNHANALYNLGYMYLYGIGCERDYKKAFGYFDKAGKLDFVPAYYIMCIMYYDGAGVKKNLKRAYKYCSMALDKGYKSDTVTLDYDNKSIIINK